MRQAAALRAYYSHRRYAHQARVAVRAPGVTCPVGAAQAQRELKRLSPPLRCPATPSKRKSSCASSVSFTTSGVSGAHRLACAACSASRLALNLPARMCSASAAHQRRSRAGGRRDERHTTQLGVRGGLAVRVVAGQLREVSNPLAPLETPHSLRLTFCTCTGSTTRSEWPQPCWPAPRTGPEHAGVTPGPPTRLPGAASRPVRRTSSRCVSVQTGASCPLTPSTCAKRTYSRGCVVHRRWQTSRGQPRRHSCCTPPRPPS